MAEQVYPVDLNLETLLPGDEIIAFEEGTDSEPYYAEVVSLSEDKKSAEIKPYDNNPEEETKTVSTSNMYDVVRLVQLDGNADFVTPTLDELAIGDEVAKKNDDEPDGYLYGDVIDINLEDGLVTVEWDNDDILTHTPQELLIFVASDSTLEQVPNLLPLTIDNVIIGDAVAFEDAAGEVTYGDILEINLDDETVLVSWENDEITLQEISDLFKIIDEDHPDYVAEEEEVE